VYRAETPLGGRRLPTLPDCEAFVDEVVGSLWWVARFPSRDLAGVPRLRPGNGARQAFYREDPGRPTITLPRRYRTAAVVLHELVHWALADAGDVPNHGRTFTRVLLDVVDEFMGPAKRERLAAGLAEHSVRIGPPPRIAPDGTFDYAWDERLRLGRGRAFRIEWAAQSHAEGVLMSRAHRTITLRADEHAYAIPERDVWRVTPVGVTPVAVTPV
jgi:putative metallohydrolase (TIGR04338 family)